MLLDRYRQAIDDLFKKVRDTQTENIIKAGEIVAESVANGGCIFLSSICHHMEMDSIYRGGGPIFYKHFSYDLQIENGARQRDRSDLGIDTDGAEARYALTQSNFRPGDVLFLSSVSGRTKKVVDLAKILARYAGPVNLHIIDFTDIQLYIYQQCPHDELTIIMRRYMMRIAEMLAEKNGCLSLVTGESIGQVASQTMQSLVCTDAACTMPVFRPLIAFDKQDIVEISEKIGTYETSIEPYEDCCTIFVAKHPVTKPLLHKIEKSEENLREKIGEMVKTAVDTEEVIWC